MNGARKRLGQLIEYAGLQLILALSTRESYGPLPLFANEHNGLGLAPLWFEKVKRSLRLIEETSPWVFSHLIRDVDRLLIDEIRGSAYSPVGRVIRVYGPGIHAPEVERIAMTIVHEATHARIASLRIPYSRDARGRHEAVCCRAEARFAQRLGREDLADQALAKLDRRWWTDEALNARSLEEFDRLDLDDPIGRALRRSIEKRTFLDP